MAARVACTTDIKAVQQLLAETWHATYDNLYGTAKVDEIAGRWHSEAALDERLHCSNSCFLVFEVCGAIQGMAFASLEGSDSILKLHQLYVSPRMQGKGLGTRLLTEVMSRFPEVEAVRLEVEQANSRAIDFYAAHNFKPVGVTTNCGNDSEIPALIMERRRI